MRGCSAYLPRLFKNDLLVFVFLACCQPPSQTAHETRPGSRSTLIASTQHLLAENVFLDTEVFIRARFDFAEGQLARLSKLAQTGRLRLLTTSITRREVARHLEKRVRESIDATRRELPLLRQSGVEISPIPSVDEAIAQALRSFDEFLKRSHVVEVALQADLEQLFERYFSQKAPFSEKKPKEFPDAVVASSLRAWCEPSGLLTYVVSGDRDFDEVCASTPCFFKADSIADVLTPTTIHYHRQSADIAVAPCEQSQ